MQCCAAHGGTVALHCIAGGVWRVARRTFASVHAACVMLLVERCTLHAAYDIQARGRASRRALQEHRAYLVDVDGILGLCAQVGELRGGEAQVVGIIRDRQ